MSRLAFIRQEYKVAWGAFATRKKLNLTDLRKTYIDFKRQDATPEGQVAFRNAPIAPKFMRHDDVVKVSAEADKVEAFCADLSLQSLEEGPYPPCFSQKPVALMDRISAQGDRIIDPSVNGPLTMLQLYRIMQDRHFGPSEGDPSLPEGGGAWRTRMFVSDLDRWAACAIMATALRYQVPAIRSMIYHHLDFRPQILLETPAGRKFQLSFHLPYRPLRDSLKPREDARRWNWGHPLRTCFKVPVLTPHSQSSTKVLYEAQTSLCVVGKDDWTWDTICFEDSYFNRLKEGKNLVETYSESTQLVDGTFEPVDPCLRGRYESRTMRQGPRQYFLKALTLNLENVEAEWTQVVGHIRDAIRYHRHCDQQQRESPPKQSGRNTELENTMSWTVLIRDLSHTLLSQLRELNTVVGRFLCNDIAHFEGINCENSLVSLIQISDRLKDLEKKLKSDVKDCKNLSSNMDMRLKHETYNAGRESTHDNKFFTMMTMIGIWPLALTAALFSMEKDVLPFKGVQHLSYLSCYSS